jgi:hypothetical protein
MRGITIPYRYVHTFWVLCHCIASLQRKSTVPLLFIGFSDPCNSVDTCSIFLDLEKRRTPLASSALYKGWLSSSVMAGLEIHLYDN